MHYHYKTIFKDAIICCYIFVFSRTCNHSDHFHHFCYSLLQCSCNEINQKIIPAWSYQQCLNNSDSASEENSSHVSLSAAVGQERGYDVSSAAGSNLGWGLSVWSFIVLSILWLHPTVQEHPCKVDWGFCMIMWWAGDLCRAYPASHAAEEALGSLQLYIKDILKRTLLLSQVNWWVRGPTIWSLWLWLSSQYVDVVEHCKCAKYRTHK